MLGRARRTARAWTGVFRSLRVYRLDRGHARGLVRLYGEFVSEGALVFDIGAHVGDRVAAFRGLGAKVVAVEPQARLMRTLRLLHGGDLNVTLVRAAVGREAGEARLRLNLANPSVATRSEAFVSAAARAVGWEGQVWEAEETVPCVTLDALIAAHGAPDFVKIDVEGWEAEALAGLSTPPPALSFEVVMAERQAGLAALQRCAELDFRRFRLSLGERHAWDTDWIGAPEMRRRLETLPDEVNSGDVYARL